MRCLGNHRETPNWYVNAERTPEEDSGLAWLRRLISTQQEMAKEQAA